MKLALVKAYLYQFTINFCGTMKGCVDCMCVTNKVHSIFLAVQSSLWSGIGNILKHLIKVRLMKNNLTPFC